MGSCNQRNGQRGSARKIISVSPGSNPDHIIYTPWGSAAIKITIWVCAFSTPTDVGSGAIRMDIRQHQDLYFARITHMQGNRENKASY